MITCTKRLIDLLSWNRILEKREREYRVCGFRTFSYISINYEARICPRYSNGLPPLGPPIRPNYLITRYLVPAPPGGQARRIKVFIRPIERYCFSGRVTEIGAGGRRGEGGGGERVATKEHR